jgi:hypothetical protein
VTGTFANSEHARSSNGASGVHLTLADVPPPAGLLGRLRKRSVPSPGTLFVAADGVVIESPGAFRSPLSIPWSTFRKVAVDDGARWGGVSGSCRFPVYDIRSDRMGSGALIGPLWSHAAALMPEACREELIAPVPLLAPNIAFVFEPLLTTPPEGGAQQQPPAPIAALMLCVADPDAARSAFSSSVAVGDVDHDDLEYLNKVGQAGPVPASVAPPSITPPLRRTRAELNGHRAHSSARTP